MLGGYVEQTAPEPKGDTPELIGQPGKEDAPLNYAYAIQWWLFAAAVPGRLVRPGPPRAAGPGGGRGQEGRGPRPEAATV